VPREEVARAGQGPGLELGQVAPQRGLLRGVAFGQGEQRQRAVERQVAALGEGACRISAGLGAAARLEGVVEPAEQQRGLQAVDPEREVHQRRGIALARHARLRLRVAVAAVLQLRQQLLLREQRIDHELEVGVARDRQAALDRVAHVAQQLAREQHARGLVAPAVDREGVVAARHGELVGAPDVVARRARGLRPRNDHGAEGHVDPAAVAREATLVDQVQRERAELARRGVVAVAHAEHLGHADVAVGRGIGMAVRDAQPRHVQQDQVDQVLVGVERGRDQVGKDVGDGTAQRVGHDRQLPEGGHAVALDPGLQRRMLAVHRGGIGLARQFDAGLAQEGQADVERAVEAAQRGVERRAQAREIGAEDAFARDLLQGRQTCLGQFERTGHELGLAAQGACMQAILARVVFAQEGQRGAEEAERRVMGGGGLGLPAGLEVEPREGAALLGRVDGRWREAGLHGEREALRRRALMHTLIRELAAHDLKVQARTLAGREREVGGLADAVVPEHPVLALAVHAAGFVRGLEHRIERTGRPGAGRQAHGHRERFGRGAVAEAGQDAQRRLR
jgi:hypothetical protein